MNAIAHCQPSAASEELDYLLRRAEEEAVAEIRSVNAVVAERHGAMARAYRTQALDLFAAIPRPPAAY